MASEPSECSAHRSRRRWIRHYRTRRPRLESGRTRASRSHGDSERLPVHLGDATGAPQDQQELEKIIGQLIFTKSSSTVSEIPGRLVRKREPAATASARRRDRSGVRRQPVGRRAKTCRERAPSAAATFVERRPDRTPAGVSEVCSSRARRSLVQSAAERSRFRARDRQQRRRRSNEHADRHGERRRVASRRSRVRRSWPQHAPIPALRTVARRDGRCCDVRVRVRRDRPLAVSAWMRAKRRVAELRRRADRASQHRRRQRRAATSVEFSSPRRSISGPIAWTRG